MRDPPGRPLRRATETSSPSELPEVGITGAWRRRYSPARADGTSGALPPRVLAIAASTGGPSALVTVLSQLPRDFALPILIAQHMPAHFTASLADRLEQAAGRPCAEGRNGEPVVEGHGYVAPGDFHMTVAAEPEGAVIRLDRRPRENHCRPAADRLLWSVAEVYGRRALVLVLTGMGEDGRIGCARVVETGGRVLVQDRETSVVWGMPGAVATAGLATEVLPLGGIASRIRDLCTV